MNNGTELIINKALTDLLETIGQAKDFTVEQAPEVIRQQMNYDLFSGFLMTTVILIFTLLVAIFFHYTAKEQGAYTREKLEIITTLVGISFAGIIMSLLSLSTVFKILLSPKVYALEYIRSLI